MSASSSELDFLKDASKDIFYKVINLHRIVDNKILKQIELISALELLIRPLLYNKLKLVTSNISDIEIEAEE